MAKEMLFSVVCPTCEAKIGVHDKRLVNQLVQCPKCGSIVLLSPPKGYSKNGESPQKKEDKSEQPAPPLSKPTSQPVATKKVINENTQPDSSPSTVSKSATVPVPPPAAIPVPPPVSIPEPIAPQDYMPELMSPGGYKSNSSVGKSNLLQRLRSMSENLPLWTPYLVIGIGVIALSLLLFFFFFQGEKQNVNNNIPPTIEDTASKDDENKIEKSGKKVSEDSEDKKNSEEKASVTAMSDGENNEDTEKEKKVLENKDVQDGKNVEDENKEVEDSGLPDDNLDKEKSGDDVLKNNEPVENDENVVNNDEILDDPQPEENSEVDNPLPNDEPNTDSEPESNAPAEDNPFDIEDGEATEDNETSNNADNAESNSEDSSSNIEILQIPGLKTELKSISIQEIKLSQCLQTIRELGSLPVEVNWDSLRRNGVNADDKISWSGKDVTVQTALSEILAQRGLMFKINEEDKIVFVPMVSVNARSGSGVNSGEQGSAMVKTQYSVSDLVGHSPEQTALLIKSIRDFLCPGDWKEVGGTGTISSSGGGSVIITQSQHNQWIIADFLDRLRLARRLAPLHNKDASLEPMSVRAQSALKRNVGINFQPTADLKTALSEIGQRISVNILLDEPSLKIAGISAQFPISFDARELSLEETFNRIKEETGLTYLAQTPNSFIVTTTEGAKSMMTVEFYPISDLVNIGLTPTVLMEQIVKFEPKSWKSQDAASFGLIDYDANSDCLIVRQSPAVISQISQLLTQLRARLKQKE